MKQHGDARSRGRLRRHLRWSIPLVVGVVGYIAPLSASSALLSTLDPDDPSDAGSALAAFGLIVLAFVIPLIASIFFVVGVVTCVRDWRRDRRHATGKYNRTELADLAHRERHARAWAASSQLRSTLANREVPQQIRVWDVVPRPDEAFFYDTSAAYARFYGQNVSYTHSGGFFFGHPLFVAAGVALSAAGNSARRSAAEAAAREQWREHQTVRLVVSNQRLICNVNGQWLSFDYAAMSAVYPEVEHWSLVCQFDSAEPLMLQGPDVPAAALITVLMTYGPEAVAEHPSLTPLGR